MAITDRRLPFAEQIAAIRRRTANLIPTERWTDLMGAAHDRAFVVAGAMKADLLADFAAAIEAVAEEGRSIQWFREQFDAIVERHGWAYRGARNWRSRVIYSTNLRTSYAAGRLAQLRDPALQRIAPYWMYRHSGTAENPRLQHQAWHGLTLPADDPWWQVHYPPNGWGCGCYVIAVRERDIERLGGRLVDTPPPDPPGAIGRGWDYMPGDTVSGDIRDTVARKYSERPYAVAAALLSGLNRELAEAGQFRRWREQPDGDWPLVRLPDADVAALGAQERVGRLSAETMRKQDREHPELSDAEYAAAQEVIDQHTHRIQDTDQSMIYARVVDDADAGGHVLVVKATRSGQALFVTSYRRMSRDAAERDREIRRLLRRG